MRLFIDLDGVLADFDAHYKAVFGVESDKKLDNVDWEWVRASKDFFLNIPMMPGATALWEYVSRYGPIVLTGVPRSVEEACSNKKAWVKGNLGAHVEVRCCRSSEKCNHAEPGDILIDDWEKYRDNWIKSGGIWITHDSAADTIQQLQVVGF